MHVRVYSRTLDMDLCNKKISIPCFHKRARYYLITNEPTGICGTKGICRIEQRASIQLHPGQTRRQAYILDSHVEESGQLDQSEGRDDGINGSQQWDERSGEAVNERENGADEVRNRVTQIDEDVLDVCNNVTPCGVDDVDDVTSSSKGQLLYKSVLNAWLSCNEHPLQGRRRRW